MNKLWDVVNDDELLLVDKTVGFLQGEFCPEGSDPIWSRDYFEWKLGKRNPAGTGYIALATIDEQVIGTVSITKKRALLDGRECIVGEIGDSYSSAQYRRNSKARLPFELDENPDSYFNKSIFGRLASEVRKRALEDGVDIIYGAPNENAYPGWIKRLDYIDNQGAPIIPFFKPTVEFVANRFSLPSPIKFLLLFAERVITYVDTQVTLNIWNRNLTIEEEWPENRELDELWQRNKPDSGFSLIRDSQYWDNRYVQYPLGSYQMFTVRNNNDLVGVFVTRKHKIEESRVYVSLLEWLLDPGVSFHAVLAFLSKQHLASKVEMFNFWALKKTPEAKSSWPHIYLSRGRKPIIFANTRGGKSVMSSDGKFDFHMGSSDAV